MKTQTKKKSRVKSALESSLAGCMKYAVPLTVLGPLTLLLFGFIILQIQNMYIGDWASFEHNLIYLGGLVTSYLLGGTPKKGLLGKFW